MKKVLFIVLIITLFGPNAIAAKEGFKFNYQDINEGVSLHTGDFQFEYPLMTIPGRGGLDYDLKLRYKAGINTKQEASWIGLGWDLSVEKITRTHINIPDDYCGGCLNEPINFRIYHRLDSNHPAYISVIMNALGENAASLANPISLPLVAYGVVERITSEENQMRINCNGWCDLHVNGFKWYNVDQQGLTSPKTGNQNESINNSSLYSTERMNNNSVQSKNSLLTTGPYYAFDINNPDIYTVSGNYLSNQIIISNYPGQETTPYFHLKKSEGHATDQVNMDLCQGNPARCQDAVFIDYITNETDHTFSEIRITVKDGTTYRFKPTQKFKNPGTPNYAYRVKKTVDPSSTCDFSGSDYTEIQYLKDFAYEFGISEILGPNYFDSNQNGYADDGDEGNWIKFNYTTWVSDFKKVNPYDGTCIEGPDGRQVYTEAYHEMSYLNRIETPTHYAEFIVAFDRTDSREYGGTRHPPRLSEIRLYSKADPSTVLESQVFAQNYFLMPGTPDSEEGRLTLVNVTKKGYGGLSSQPPIQFNYGGGLFCGDGQCNYDENCFTCHSDCSCGYDDWTEGYEFYSEGYCSGNPGYLSWNCAWNPPPAPPNSSSWFKISELDSYWFNHDSSPLIQGGENYCGCPVDWEFITWVWSNETFVKNMQLSWDDDYTIYVWNNCGETFNSNSCNLQKYCKNNPATDTWNPTFTRGWNVVEVRLINDGGPCRAQIFDDFAKSLSNDDRLWVMDGLGVDEYRSMGAGGSQSQQKAKERITSSRLDTAEIFGINRKKPEEINFGKESSQNEYIFNLKRSLLDYDPKKPQINVVNKKKQRDTIQLNNIKKTGKTKTSMHSFGEGSYNPTWGKYKFDRWGYYYEYGSKLNHNQEGYKNGLHADAWSLTDIIWPTGGFTSIKYENDRYTAVNNYMPDAIGSDERDDTHYGGGVRVSEIKNCDGLGEYYCTTTKYLYSKNDFNGWDVEEDDGYGQPGVPGESSGVATIEPGNFELWNDVVYKGSSIIEPYVGYSKVTVIEGWDGFYADHGWVTYEFTTALDSPNEGKYIPENRWTVNGMDYGYSTEDGSMPISSSYNCPFLFIAPAGHHIKVYENGFYAGETWINDDCNLYDTTPSLKCESWIFGGVTSMQQGSWNNTEQLSNKVKRFILPSTKNKNTSYKNENLQDSIGQLNKESMAPLVSRLQIFDMDNNGGTEILLIDLSLEEPQRCCVDNNKNGECDLVEYPSYAKTSANFDNDHGRGLLKRTTYFDSTGSPVRIVEYNYTSEIQTNFGNGYLKSVWTHLDKINDTTDGATKITEYEYNILNGLPNRIIEYKDDGKKRITTIKYAYADNTAMQIDEHMWSQVGEVVRYDTIETPSKRVESKRYVYANNFNGNSDRQWFVKEEYDGVGAEEIKTKTYVDYDDYGNVVHEKDASGNSTWTYYGNNNECGTPTNPEATGSQWNHAHPTCVENAKHQKSLMSYDTRGNLIQETDVNGVRYDYTFDEFSRLNTTSRNGVLLEKFDYYLAGNNLDANNYNYLKKTKQIDNGVQMETYKYY
ncbi:MAG: hypothetical protein D6797_08130, partial [Bdellovibrio sp.]